MRTLLLAAALLLLAAPATDATCHVCLEQVEEDCLSGDVNPDDCAATAIYAAIHYPQHLLNDDD